MHAHCNAKNYVFIAAILSELHASWQTVMQDYVIGLLNLLAHEIPLALLYTQDLKKH